MPGKVKVKIVAGRNLPVMDRSSDTTDAYVEIKLGNTTFKTDVCRKSLNPRWNSEWYRFEVDDSELQDEPLQIRLMDYDTYSANDAIGKVYLDLNPLLLPTKFGSEAGACPVTVSSSGGKSGGSASTSSMSGWIPVYDTMHGIRGEVNVSVKVELFNDFNKFRQSSCGVQFFYSSTIPHGYCARAVHGFVEELVVDDDPEYRWIDKIRTPRASNEARQTLFFKLSGEVRRKIGLKASELGGNAVVGYRQRFDLEGESGIVARGIGTAITLIKLQDASLAELDTWETNSKEERACDSLLGTSLGSDCDSVPGRGHHRTESVGAKGSKSNAVSCMHRRSSDSDLSITPKGNSLSNSDRPNGPAPPNTTVPGGTTNSNSPYDALIRSAMKQGEMLEYPFLTMTKFPTGFIIHLGGTVSARSVKLLDRACNPDETESRDSWWTELRMEIRSHARALACNVVLGYSEHTSICDDVCVLSASGTAAVANLHYDTCETGVDILLTSIRFDQITDRKAGDSPKHDMAANKEDKQTLSNGDIENVPLACAICHVPYCESSVPFPITMLKCGVCRHSNIPDVLITTIELPDESLVTGRGCLIQASVCRPKRDLRGELDAKEISDVLPFLEYDLHRLLINKLKVKGMNAIFGLEVHVSIGERIIVGTATGTGVFLLALPAPSLPMLIVGDLTTSEEKLAETQKLLIETVKSNRETYKVKQVEEVDERLNKPIKSTDIKESEDEPRKLDLTGGDKDSCVLEIDDAEDNELLTLILEPRPPDGFFVVNTEFAPGLDEYDVVENVQTFKQMSRVKLAPHCTPSFGKHFQRLLRTIYFKLRHRAPCTIRRLQFGIDIPEADEIQLTVLGTAIGLSKATRSSKLRRRIARSISKDAEKKSDDIDGIFSLEEDEERENTRDTSESSNDWPIRSRSKSPGDVHTRLLFKSHSQASSRHGIDITSLSFVPGAKIKHYLGNLNFCFIRESTSIREESGPSGFVHGFVADVLAIVRAHITALGGNAMVAYFMTECSLFHNPHKNQGQCLINVGGDVVFVSYFAD